MNFTSEDVYNEVVRLSEEMPDFIYTKQPGRLVGDGCGYAGRTVGTTQGQACIVGQALMNLGVPVEELLWCAYPADILVQTSVLPNLSDQFPALIRDIQNNQDKGYTWSESVKLAHEDF